MTKKDKCFVIIVICLILIIASSIMNFQVMQKNDCKMPVKNFPDADYQKYYFNYQDKQEINLWFLSDFMGFSLPYDYEIRFSLGDIISIVAILLFIFYMIRYLMLSKRKK